MANHVIQEDDEHVLCGPEPYEPIPNRTLGAEIYNSLISNNCNYEAMVDAFTGKRLSYQQLLQDSCNLAEALKRAGYKEQTMCSISSENNLNFFIPVIASLFNGYIMAPLNHTYTLTELTHTLNITQPKVIFCTENLAKKYVELKKRFDFIERIITIDSEEDNGSTVGLNIFINQYLKDSVVLPQKFKPFNKEPATTAAFIMCSSGTTGLPKGVVLSHTNIMVRVLIVKDPRYKIISEEASTTLGILPFFHGYGLIFSLTSIIYRERIVCMNKSDEDAFLTAIQNYKIRRLFLVPPLALLLAKTDKLRNYDLSCVKTIFCGSAPFSKDTELELKKRLNVSDIKQGYGLTEATIAVILASENEELKPGSSGKVVPYMKCKIRDPETGKSLEPHKMGEICIKGPKVMMGYYKNEKATKETFTTDGWLRTGDLGYYDDEGYFFIIDRLKELIKYNGYQVAPSELEAILINHPSIADAGVVGLPDELCGELPVALVVKKPGQDVSEKELYQYVAERVSPPKYLRGGIIFLESIPKSLSGKILRRDLRGMLQDYKEKLKPKLE